MAHTIKVLTHDKIEEATKLILKAFRYDNPLHFHIRDQYQDEEFALVIQNIFMKGFVPHGMCLYAEDDCSGAMVAVLTAGPRYCGEEQPFTSGNDALDQILKVIGALHEMLPAEIDEAGKDGKVLAIGLGATIREVSGKGLASKLRNQAIENARLKGFHYVVVEPANPAMQHIYKNKLGFTICGQIKMSEAHPLFRGFKDSFYMAYKKIN